MLGWMHVLTIWNNIRKKCCPPPKWVVGGWVEYGGCTSRGVMGLLRLLVVVLACAGMLVMHAAAGPICVVVDTCPDFY